ncbi:MAG: hypothetical protein Tsb0013_17310 [Phycisphaerales bacterium]
MTAGSATDSSSRTGETDVGGSPVVLAEGGSLIGAPIVRPRRLESPALGRFTGVWASQKGV